MRARDRRAMRMALDVAAIPTWTPRPIAPGGGKLAFSHAPGRLPTGERVYAIGDIRGDLGALMAMQAAISEDLAARPARRAALIHLGDVIGADPRTADVLALLATAGPSSVTLRGDHEQMLLDALDGDSAAATDWRHETGSDAREGWPARLSAELLAFLRGLPDHYRAGTYFFAHAGVRPGIPLARQSGADLRGIRQIFLSSERPFGAVVVHGHSVVPSPVVLPNRIAIDTGAGFGGPLTCAVLEEDRIAFLAPASGGARA